MSITVCGYARGREIFSLAEIQQLQASITDAANRLARGFLTPYATSLPDLPLEERLEQVARAPRSPARRGMSSFWIGFCRTVTLPNQTTRIRWTLVMWVKCRS